MGLEAGNIAIMNVMNVSMDRIDLSAMKTKSSRESKLVILLRRIQIIHCIRITDKTRKKWARQLSQVLFFHRQMNQRHRLKMRTNKKFEGREAFSDLS